MRAGIDIIMNQINNLLTFFKSSRLRIPLENEFDAGFWLVFVFTLPDPWALAPAPLVKRQVHTY